MRWCEALAAATLLVTAAQPQAAPPSQPWLEPCEAVAARSVAAREWLKARSQAQAPRSCFLASPEHLLFLASRNIGHNLASLSLQDLRRRGASSEVLMPGDVERVAEFTASNGRHYALVRSESGLGGVERLRYALLALADAPGAKRPVRLVPVYARTTYGCQAHENGPDCGSRHAFSGGTAAGQEIALRTVEVIVEPPELVSAGGKVTALAFPWNRGEKRVVYRFTPGPADFEPEGIDLLAGVTQRKFQGASVRIKQLE